MSQNKRLIRVEILMVEKDPVLEAQITKLVTENTTFTPFAPDGINHRVYLRSHASSQACITRLLFSEEDGAQP